MSAARAGLPEVVAVDRTVGRAQALVHDAMEAERDTAMAVGQVQARRVAAFGSTERHSKAFLPHAQ